MRRWREIVLGVSDKRMKAKSLIQRAKRRAGRAVFALRLERHPLKGIQITPEISGKRLVLKKPHANPQMEERVMSVLMAMHEELPAENYELSRPKRYPSIKGRRTEPYYDGPTLGELIDMRRTRNVARFLKEHGMTREDGRKLASDAYKELEGKVAFAPSWENGLHRSLPGANAPVGTERPPFFDPHEGQFIVTSAKMGGGRRKLGLVMVDM